MAKKALLFVVVLSITLSACGSSYDRQLHTLTTLLQWMQIGDGQDHWLEQYSEFGRKWDRVALVFGYVDDYDACTQLINGLGQEQPLAKYRCVPTN